MPHPNSCKLLKNGRKRLIDLLRDVRSVRTVDADRKRDGSSIVCRSVNASLR